MPLYVVPVLMADAYGPGTIEGPLVYIDAARVASVRGMISDRSRYCDTRYHPVDCGNARGR